MKTSQNGLAFIAENEGTVLHVYNDSLGNPTIGVGHLLTPSEKASGVFDNGITQAQALALLAVDVGTAEAAVNSNVNVQLTQNAFDACVDFTFNCGGGAFASSTFLKDINAGDTQAAANAILMWDIPASIMGRRHRERTLFLAPDAAPPATPPAPSPVTPPAEPLSNPPPAPVSVLPVPSPVPAPAPGPTSVFQSIIDGITWLVNVLTQKRS
jgi:lysozyme